MYKKLSFIILTVLVLLFFFSFDAKAQLATVKGTVTDEATGDAIQFAHVLLKGQGKGSVTDENGYFSIPRIDSGSYTLVFTYIGYDTLSIDIHLDHYQVLTRNVKLSASDVTLDLTEIVAERHAAKIDPRASVTKISPKQITKLPAIGDPDLVQYLQVVPGVVFTGDQGGQLYIRGGTPVQNMVLLDGMIIYNPFHSIGLFSVFDADIIKSADIYTGGFGAEYGGRISSVMDISTRPGNNKRFSGKLSASTFGAKLLLEGPIVKPKANGGSLSYILSAKKSYINETSKSIYSYVNDGQGLPFTFTDVYGKVSLDAKAGGSKVDLFGFSFNDQVTYETINNYQWNSYGGGMRALLVPESTPMLMEATLAFSNYEIQLDDGSLNPRRSEVGGFNVGLNFTYFMGKNNLRYGVEMKGFSTDYEFTNSLNRKIQQQESTTEASGYAAYRLMLGSMGNGKQENGKSDAEVEAASRWIITAGLRLHYYASLGNTSPEPRIAAKLNATDFFRVKLAAGMYSQNLISTASDRDVVNLFYGFISGPDNLQKEFNGEPLTHKLQKSNHLVLGFELDVLRNFMVNLEGYYKYFPQLTNLNRNKIFDDEPQYVDKPDVLKKDFIIEEGESYGMDVSVKYSKRPFYVWAVYSLGYSFRYDGIVEYEPHFDRRHNVNLVGTYTFGKLDSWEVSARWNFGSGFPFTPTAGNYELLTFEDGIGTDYTTTNGQLGIIYGSLNSKRLPSYHRLDIGLKKDFLFSERTKLSINFNITNVYDRNNIFYIDRINNERVDQLPIMPSLGMSVTF